MQAGRRSGTRRTVARGVWPVRRCAGQRGAVTAEVAIVMPVLMATMLLGLWAVGIVVTNIRCIDAARDVARAVARGEPVTTAQEIGERAAPAGAVVSISQEGSTVRVTVTSESKLDWTIVNELPAVSVEGRATVEVEPGIQHDESPIQHGESALQEVELAVLRVGPKNQGELS